MACVRIYDKDFTLLHQSETDDIGKAFGELFIVVDDDSGRKAGRVVEAKVVLDAESS